MLSGINCTLSEYLLYFPSNSANPANLCSADFLSRDGSWPRVGIVAEDNNLLEDYCLREWEGDSTGGGTEGG